MSDRTKPYAHGPSYVQGWRDATARVEMLLDSWTFGGQDPTLKVDDALRRTIEILKDAIKQP